MQERRLKHLERRSRIRSEHRRRGRLRSLRTRRPAGSGGGQGERAWFHFGTSKPRGGSLNDVSRGAPTLARDTTRRRKAAHRPDRCVTQTTASPPCGKQSVQQAVRTVGPCGARTMARFDMSSKRIRPRSATRGGSDPADRLPAPATRQRGDDLVRVSVIGITARRCRFRGRTARHARRAFVARRSCGNLGRQRVGRSAGWNDRTLGRDCGESSTPG